jgi:hypothetical protein
MRPFTKQKVIKDNCSICIKNGYLLAFALRQDVRWIRGKDNMSEYRFHLKEKSHKFCSHCGSSMIVDLNDALPKDLVAVNVR